MMCFDSPFSFDVCRNRTASRVVSGAHYCLGASLAPMGARFFGER